MSSLTETVFFVFGLVALGYLSGWTGYLQAEVGNALSQFAVAIALPLLLFRTMVSADFHGAAPWHLWGAYFAAVIVAWTAGNLVTTRLFGRDAALGVVGGISAAFSNTVLVGVPLVLGVYGQDGIDILYDLFEGLLPIVDDLVVLAVGMRPPTRQGDEMGTADEHVETIIVKAHPQLVADQAGRHGVEHLAQGEAAA